MKINKLLLFVVFLFCNTVVNSQNTNDSWISDNGDGTFTNPILWGDWPDPDIIRVGDEYYFVSTSMHFVPGCPVLKSKDLVNWEMSGYAVSQYDEDEKYDMHGGTMYLNGSWASTIRYHKGLFYVGFCTPYGNPDGNFSICTAKDPAGPWKRTIFPEYLYDPGLLFDDDGKVYVAHGQGTLYITELNEDALSVKTEKREIFSKSCYPYLEGCHFYKIDGKYYILASYGGTGGKQVCLRSDNIYGPYESKIVIDDYSNFKGNGLHQGGMLQLKNGDWWFMVMQDRGAQGRTPNLEPVKWVDGWPMLGEEGKGVVTYTKPTINSKCSIRTPATSDDFSSDKLGLQWQWNHNPNNTKWSLKERPGYLRLKAEKASDNSIVTARNTLTQRLQGPSCEGSTEMDVRGMKDGDVAGLCVFQNPYSYVAIKQQDGLKKIIMVNNGDVIETVDNFKGDRIWLKAKANCIVDSAIVFYSLNGNDYEPIGNSLKMHFAGWWWTGYRFGLFNYSENKSGGYVDFNQFIFKSSDTKGNLHSAYDLIEIERYDSERGRDLEWKEGASQYLTNIEDEEWICFDRIDFGTKGAKSFTAQIASDANGTIEIRCDSLNGKLLGTCEINNTGAKDIWKIERCGIKRVKGVKTIFLIFKGESFNFDWFKFNQSRH